MWVWYRKLEKTHTSKTARDIFFIFRQILTGLILFPAVMRLKCTLIKQLKGTTTWSTMVTTVMRHTNERKSTEMVIWWSPVDSQRHYNSDPEANTKTDKLVTNAYELTIIRTPKLTKQHHLLNDFAIQNICAKMFRQNTKTRPLLVKRISM